MESPLGHDEPMANADSGLAGDADEANTQGAAGAKTTGLPEQPQQAMSMSESIPSPPSLQPSPPQHTSLFRSNQTIHDALDGGNRHRPLLSLSSAFALARSTSDDNGMANPLAGSTNDGNASADPPPPPPANGSRTRDGDHGGVRGKQKRRRKKTRVASSARLKDPVPPILAQSAIPAQRSKSSGQSRRAFGTSIDANQLQPLSALVPTEAPTKKRKPTSASRALPNADGSHAADSASASAPNVRSELLEGRHAVAAVAGSTSSSALSSHDSNETGSPSTIPLPKRVRDAPPPEIADPTQFECDLATWSRIPTDLRQCLVDKFTDSNDPYGLCLRCNIRMLRKSLDSNGQCPLYLLRRKKPRYGTWKKQRSMLHYAPSLRRAKGQKDTKLLPDSDNDDDLQDCYFPQVLYSNGKYVKIDSGTYRHCLSRRYED